MHVSIAILCMLYILCITNWASRYLTFLFRVIKLLHFFFKIMPPYRPPITSSVLFLTNLGHLTLFMCFSSQRPLHAPSLLQRALCNTTDTFTLTFCVYYSNILHYCKLFFCSRPQQNKSFLPSGSGLLYSALCTDSVSTGSSDLQRDGHHMITFIQCHLQSRHAFYI